MCTAADVGELLTGCEAREIRGDITIGDGLPKRRDADHEEFVEVRRHNRSELEAFHQRRGWVGRLLEHSLVEGQP